MLRDLKGNRSGIIMVTVLVVSMVLVVMAVGVMGINISQVNLGEQQVKHIQAEQLALGVWSIVFSEMTLGRDISNRDFSQTIDGHVYNATVSLISSGTGPKQTDTYRVRVTY